MIVVDANVTIYLYISNPQTQDVLDLLKADSEWVVPFLWPYEFRNAVLQHVRHASLQVVDALKMIQDAEKRFENRMDKAVAADVMTLAFATKCSAYDCEYVALAQKLQVPLLTYDKKALREFPKIAIKPRDYLNSL